MANHTFGETLLRIEHLDLDFKEKNKPIKVVLRDVNAEIRDIKQAGKVRGQIVGFLGPSGIGKTQLFRTIGGLQKPTRGHVWLNGYGDNPTGVVGIVSQSYPLFAFLTVRKNLEVAAKRKMTAAEGSERIGYYAKRFELEQCLDLYPVQLSGGQRQRAAIVQQVLCSDHFIFMDEPFSGLDPEMIRQTSELIVEVANLHELNTIVVVTHDVTAAATVADHIWLMGRDRDEAGNIIPGARIQNEYNLVADGFAWEEGVTRTQRFMDFVWSLKDQFKTL